MRTLRVLRAFGPLLALASLLGGSHPAGAQAFSDPGSGFGVFAAFAQPSTSGQAGPQAGLLFRSRLTGGLGVELGASYRATKYSAGGEDLLRLSTVPVTVTIQVFPLTNSRIQPFLLGGGGYTFARAKGLGRNAERGGQTEHKLGLHGGLGVDVRLRPGTSLTFEVRRVFLDVNAVSDTGALYGTARRADFTSAGISFVLTK